MFNLEEAISDWRRQMLAAGIKSPTALDELENHVRDDIEQRVRSGLNSGHAFEAAVRQIGRAALLGSEFDKIGGMKALQERLKKAVCTLAGIPNYYLATPMKTSHSSLEPGWASYMKAAAFLLPGLCLWRLSMVFILPKLNEICGSAIPVGEASIWKITHLNFGIMNLLREKTFMIAGAIILTLILLEWRSVHWPRYRRAVLGIGAFLVNSVVLISIFFMIITATFAASVLFQPAKYPHPAAQNGHEAQLVK